MPLSALLVDCFQHKPVSHPQWKAFLKMVDDRPRFGFDRAHVASLRGLLQTYPHRGDVRERLVRPFLLAAEILVDGRAVVLLLGNEVLCDHVIVAIFLYCNAW